MTDSEFKGLLKKLGEILHNKMDTIEEKIDFLSYDLTQVKHEISFLQGDIDSISTSLEDQEY